MKQAPEVLILTSDEDESADLVVEHLQLLGAGVHRVDLSAFPQRIGITATLGQNIIPSGWVGSLAGALDLELSACSAIYYRRPSPFDLPADLPTEAVRFIELEGRAGMLGVLAALPGTWINHPETELPASYKAIQLARSERFGLFPPATLITNSKADVLAFAKRLGGRVLHKGIGKDLVAPGAALIPETRVVQLRELVQSGGLEATTHLFQEVINKTHDVRLTVVGSWMTAVEIHAPSDEIDWRTTYGQHEYRQTSVPDAVVRGVRELMDSFGIAFCTFDFAVDQDQRWRFLEINSNGEWLWLERALSLGIAHQIALHLSM